jgi:hypothetical protein
VNNYIVRTLAEDPFPALTRGTTVLDARAHSAVFGFGNKLRSTFASRSRLPGVPSSVRPEGVPEEVGVMRMPRIHEEIDEDTSGEADEQADDFGAQFEEYFGNRTWRYGVTDAWNLFLDATGVEEEDEQDASEEENGETDEE